MVRLYVAFDSNVLLLCCSRTTSQPTSIHLPPEQQTSSTHSNSNPTQDTPRRHGCPKGSPHRCSGWRQEASKVRKTSYRMYCVSYAGMYSKLFCFAFYFLGIRFFLRPVGLFSCPLVAAKAQDCEARRAGTIYYISRRRCGSSPRARWCVHRGAAVRSSRADFASKFVAPHAAHAPSSSYPVPTCASILFCVAHVTCRTTPASLLIRSFQGARRLPSTARATARTGTCPRSSGAPRIRARYDDDDDDDTDVLYEYKQFDR